MGDGTSHFLKNARLTVRTIYLSFYKATEAVAQDVVDRTPEDTSASKGNWQVVHKLSEVRPFVESQTQNTVASDMAEIVAKAPNNIISILGSALYIANPTPYASYYENGLYRKESEKVVKTADGFYSRQAEQGVVKKFVGQDSDTLARVFKAEMSKL